MSDEKFPATLRLDAGAVARCSWCRRYSMDPLSLSHAQGQVPVCKCGRADGWSGSFERRDVVMSEQKVGCVVCGTAEATIWYPANAKGVPMCRPCFQAATASIRPPCPICWHEETMRDRKSGDLERDLRPEETLEWHRPYGGARGQVVTRWDGGSWRCPTCDVALTPRDAAVLFDAVLTVTQETWRDDDVMRGWFEAAAKGGPT